MTGVELQGIPEAVRDFNECEGSGAICLDVRTGDVWMRNEISPHSHAKEEFYRLITKCIFSSKEITEEELLASCERCMAVLI